MGCAAWEAGAGHFLGAAGAQGLWATLLDARSASLLALLSTWRLRVHESRLPPWCHLCPPVPLPEGCSDPCPTARLWGRLAVGPRLRGPASCCRLCRARPLGICELPWRPQQGVWGPLPVGVTLVMPCQDPGWWDSTVGPLAAFGQRPGSEPRASQGFGPPEVTGAPTLQTHRPSESRPAGGERGVLR